MSLINEALKRTRGQSVPAGYAMAAPPPARYRVAAEPRPAPRRVAVWGGGLAVALVLVVGLTALTVYRLGRPAPEPSLSPASGATAGAVSVAPTQPAAADIDPVVGGALPAPDVKEALLVDRVVERLKQEQAETAAAAAADPPPAPALVLQGVSRYNGVYEAMINGYPVQVGDEIDGARLVAIDGRVVRLTWHGEELVLRLR